ncbi:MAG: hypothetical protein H8E27_03295 [Verrucomicrobia subdivision 3 bacterium]|nr:hypothetical protein [Limisphaerales bacterium]
MKKTFLTLVALVGLTWNVNAQEMPPVPKNNLAGAHESFNYLTGIFADNPDVLVGDTIKFKVHPIPEDIYGQPTPTPPYPAADIGAAVANPWTITIGKQNDVFDSYQITIVKPGNAIFANFISFEYMWVIETVEVVGGQVTRNVIVEDTLYFVNALEGAALPFGDDLNFFKHAIPGNLPANRFQIWGDLDFNDQFALILLDSYIEFYAIEGAYNVAND